MKKDLKSYRIKIRDLEKQAVSKNKCIFELGEEKERHRKRRLEIEEKFEEIQTHLAEKDLNVCFKTGHSINPLEKGHIAYRTDDLEGFKKHLKNLNINYSDWGETAVAGLQQIFFHDPDGNVIEVHEVKD